MKNSLAFCALLMLQWTPSMLAQVPKSAGEAFKNVQVLKRVPEDQWFDTMAFIAGSLGTTCDHCHSSEFEKDEGNPNNLKAREMMRMVDAINLNNFGGQVVVTCNTCHRGSIKPQGTPKPDAQHWIQASETAAIPPPALQILTKYRKTVSGVRSQSLLVRVETYEDVAHDSTLRQDVVCRVSRIIEIYVQEQFLSR